tara:strand:- start:715 stop:993 length:279 start_codon:yes stop_codon:yes gene_type:complete
MPYIQINQNLVEITDEEAAANAAEIAIADAAMLELANRETRNELLTASDWTQANDSPLTSAKKTKWKTYRQALRDLPANEDWPNVTFPEEPS